MFVHIPIQTHTIDSGIKPCTEHVHRKPVSMENLPLENYVIWNDICFVK